MPKINKIFFFSCLLLLLTAANLVKVDVPRQIKKKITDEILEQCKNCEFSTKSIQLKFFPMQAILEGVIFTTGNVRDTLIETQIERITIKLSTKKLMNHVLNFEQVIIEKPMISVTEGDRDTIIINNEGSPDNWEYEINHVIFKEARFNYIRRHFGRIGTIQISNINGEIGTIGSRPPLSYAPATGHISALLEKSGKIDLSLNTFLFSKNLNAEISLKVQDLNLDETNRYFDPVDGIQIKGKLKQAQSIVTVKGQHIQSEVRADYQGLELTFGQTFDRSVFSAMVSNLFSGVKPNKDRTRTASIDRNLEEPIVGFILRGMKEAALKVATD